MSGVQAMSRMSLLRFTRSELCINRRSPLWVQPVVLCKQAVVSSSPGYATSRRNGCQAARVSVPSKCQPLQASFANSPNLGLMPKRHSVATSAVNSDQAAEQAAHEIRPSNIYIAVSVLVLVSVHDGDQADCNSYLLVWLAAVEHIGSCCVWSSKQGFAQDGSRSFGELCILPGSIANLWLCCCLFWRVVVAIQVSETSITQSLACMNCYTNACIQQ